MLCSVVVYCNVNARFEHLFVFNVSLFCNVSMFWMSVCQTLAHLAEMKHELEMLGGSGSSSSSSVVPGQVLRCLQRNIDFQQVPHATVQQLHATIQHDFELLEQVLSRFWLSATELFQSLLESRGRGVVRGDRIWVVLGFFYRVCCI